MKAQKPPCCLIGAGRAGSALAKAMSNRGFHFDWIVSRNKEKVAELARTVKAPLSGDSIADMPQISGILIIAVSDKDITSVAKEVAEADIIVGAETVALHLSGALGPEALSALADRGVATLAFHPGQTFTLDSDHHSVFNDVVFDMEGDDRACRTGHDIAELLGATSVVLNREQRVIVHTAMSMASNYTAALLTLSENLILTTGCSIDSARAMLAPLVKNTVSNCFESGPIAALTGPVARGDINVIHDHLTALDVLDTDTGELYRLMGRIAAKIALKRGSISAETAEKLTQEFGNEQDSSSSQNKV